jgi:N utilization substance protein A
MKNEFILAFNEVIEDKQLPRDVVMEALEAAMISAYRKAVNASSAQEVEARIDPDDGRVLIYAEKEIVDSVHDHRTEVTLEDAQAVESDAEMGGMIIVETTPNNFGRVAAQTARQVIQQRMREAEREAQFNHFTAMAGDVINGVVQAVNASHLTLGLDKKAEGLMPRKEQIAGERFRVHDRVRALLVEVKLSPRGPQIMLSRAHRDFLRRLLEDEVPEIFHGLVEIRSIAREPGQRSKVAVSALQPGIDPVGACVGVRGVRIQAIVRELNEEKIDVIEWNADPSEFIAKALSPARVVGVFLNKLAKGAKTATVVVPEDQLSLAIGRDGQNARLAAKLTGWRIDIKSLPEAATDALYSIHNDEAYAGVAEVEAEVLPQIEHILEKKSEGRPITPEEYNLLSRFVVRTERQVVEQREAELQAEKDKVDAIRAGIPDAAFETPLDELGLSPRLAVLLGGEGYSTIGELIFQLELDSDLLLAVNGMGPKSMQTIEESVADYLVNAARDAAAAAAAAEIEAARLAEEAALAEAEAARVMAEAAAEMDIEQVTEALEEAERDGMPEGTESEAAETAPDSAEGADDEVATGMDGMDLEDVFNAAGQAITETTFVEDDDDSTDAAKAKKKKKQFGEVEYDPEHDIVVVKRKRKRTSKDDFLDGVEDWE